MGTAAPWRGYQWCRCRCSPTDGNEERAFRSSRFPGQLQATCLFPWRGHLLILASLGHIMRERTHLGVGSLSVCCHLRKESISVSKKTHTSYYFVLYSAK